MHVDAFRQLVRRQGPYRVLAVSLLLTLAVATFIHQATESRQRLRAQKAVLQTQHGIRNQLETYIAFMRATSALFAASDVVTRSEFATFLERLSLQSRLQGVRAVGYCARVREDESGPYVRDGRLTGLDVRIWPVGDRSEYQAIVYLESRDYRSRALLGFDLSSDSALREAMERARDSGAPAASARVGLAPGFGGIDEAGFYIFAPVYSGEGEPTSVAERRARVRGYVFSPVRADELLAGVFVSDLDMQVFDGTSTATEALLYDSAPGTRIQEPGLFSGGLSFYRSLAVAGRPWVFVYHGSIDPLERWLAASALIAGLALSLLLFRMTSVQVAARVAAEDAAAILKRSQAALRESESEAKAANRAKDAFLAMLSHELRTPLNAIMGWASILRSTAVDAERQRKALEVIDRNARVQAGLIEDLFDVSRIISGKLRFEPQEVDVLPVIQSTIEAARPSAAEKRVRLLASLEPSRSRVVADPARLQQIVSNLLSNAVKFTPAGGRVEITLRDVDGWSEITVTDTGVGIAPEFLPHVFERFRQADSTTTREHSGVGLGLSIAHHLVQLHGGQIDVSSGGRGQGAAFVVRLPLTAGAASPTPDPAQASAPAPTPAGAERAAAPSEEPVV